MKKILYPPAATPFHRKSSASSSSPSSSRMRNSSRRRHGRRSVAARTPTVTSRVMPSFRPAELVGADRERPIRYGHELHDIFDQFA